MSRHMLGLTRWWPGTAEVVALVGVWCIAVAGLTTVVRTVVSLAPWGCSSHGRRLDGEKSYVTSVSASRTTRCNSQLVVAVGLRCAWRHVSKNSHGTRRGTRTRRTTLDGRDTRTRPPEGSRENANPSPSVTRHGPSRHASHAPRAREPLTRHVPTVISIWSWSLTYGDRPPVALVHHGMRPSARLGIPNAMKT